MSINSSSSSNTSLPPAPLSTSSSTYDLFHNCFGSTVGIFGITAFIITSIVILLPLCIYVLYLGLRRQRTQRSNSSTSHSDLFTYHIVLIELLSVLGFVLVCCGAITDLQPMMTVGIYLYAINLTGQMFFHVLTCVERYLAVVHPITYLSLRQERGIRMRNITIGCAWLLSFAGTGFLPMDPIYMSIVYFCLIFFVLVVISFCSLSVLCVLIHPGPGEEGGGRRQLDRSKLRAFYTIMVILGVLMIRFGSRIITTALVNLTLLGATDSCRLQLIASGCNQPSSLVLPLLFLHRAGKIPCCKKKKKNKPGQGSD